MIVPLIAGSTILVTIAAWSNGQRTTRPIVAGVALTLLLSSLAMAAPSLGTDLAWLIFATAALTSGGIVAREFSAVL